MLQKTPAVRSGCLGNALLHRSLSSSSAACLRGGRELPPLSRRCLRFALRAKIAGLTRGSAPNYSKHEYTESRSWPANAGSEAANVLNSAAVGTPPHLLQ